MEQAEKEVRIQRRRRRRSKKHQLFPKQKSPGLKFHGLMEKREETRQDETRRR